MDTNLEQIKAGGQVTETKRVLEPEKINIGGLTVKAMPGTPMTAAELQNQCNLVSSVCPANVPELAENNA